jgi:hypothetical protein
VIRIPGDPAARPASGVRAHQQASPTRSQFAEDLSQVTYRSRRHPRQRYGMLLHALGEKLRRLDGI